MSHLRLFAVNFNTAKIILNSDKKLEESDCSCGRNMDVDRSKILNKIINLEDLKEKEIINNESQS